MNEKVYSGTLALGEIINIFDRNWRVCHIEDGKYYLGADTIKEKMVFGDNNDYGYSNVFHMAIDYEEELLKKYSDIINEHLVPIESNGVKIKVFAPTLIQIMGEFKGFKYFTDNKHRICEYNGKPCSYWTSSNITNNNEVWRIGNDGEPWNHEVYEISGFRPFICFKP